MIITTRTAASAVILDVLGRLTVEEDLEQLPAMARGLVRIGAKNLLLNLGAVWQIDCLGIGQLVRCHRETRESGASLRIFGVRPRPKRLLQMARVLTVIEAYDNEEHAVRSLQEADFPLPSKLRKWHELKGSSCVLSL